MRRLNSGEESIVDKVRLIGKEHIRPHAEQVDEEATFPTEAIQALGREALLGLTVATEFGGMGKGTRVACAVLEEISRCCASTGMVYLMHLCGLACYGAAPKKDSEQLRAAARGQHLSTLAWSERGSRSHFWAPMSQALPSDGGVRITAEKSWVTSAGYADGYVVSTRSPQASKDTDTTLYLVLKEDKGLHIAGCWRGLGMRGNASAPMKLDQMAIADERLLSREGKGFDVMLGVVLPLFQVGTAAISVGIAEAAVQATQAHLTGQRFEHLGSGLAQLPNLRARLARMRIETDRARAHLDSVIDALETPGPSTQLLVLAAKAAASESAIQVTETGMRACGGAAFSKHLTLERHFRDARASVIMAPTTDHAHDFIGRVLCGMELF